MPALTGSVTDADFRRRRAAHAAKSRTSVDHYIKQLVERAPELSEAQKSQLSLILGGSRNKGAASA